MTTINKEFDQPVAAIAVRYNWVTASLGVELDERWCEVAAKRLAQDVLDFGSAS